MLPCAPADRDPEFQLFRRLIFGQSNKRILLLEADGGMGKSRLLSEFEKCCPPEIEHATINLKGKTTGLHEIFYDLCDQVGWHHFPAFQARVAHLGQVVLENNTFIGRNHIAIALQTRDRRDRGARRVELTQAFFDDLRLLNRRLLMIFDTFDHAAPDVRGWLQGSFLAYAHRTPNLMVILAGRRVPEESIEWATSCMRHRLGAICEPEAWQKYAECITPTIHPELIRGLCLLFGGHPLIMAEAIAFFRSRGS